MNARKLTWLAALSCLGGLACPTAAQATTPTRTQVIRDVTLVHECGGFADIARLHLVREVTTFYDSDGTAVRQQIHVTESGTTSNSVTGRTLEVSGTFNVHHDLATGTTQTTGENQRLTDPATGESWQIATGRIVFDWATGAVSSTSGWFSRDVEQLICNAVSS